MYGLTLQWTFKARDFKLYDKGLALLDQAQKMDDMTYLLEYSHLFMIPKKMFAQSRD